MTGGLLLKWERGGAFYSILSLELNIEQNAPPLSYYTLKQPVIPSEAEESPEYQYHIIFVYKG